MKRYLVDTNVLIAIALGKSEVVQFIDLYQQDDAVFFITLQNICEFWNVATRPEANNGLDLSPEFTMRALERLQLGFKVLPETSAVERELLQLLREHKVRGKQIYDARLAATVRAHNLDGILTLNHRDFLRYADVNPILPSA